MFTLNWVNRSVFVGKMLDRPVLIERTGWFGPTYPSFLSVELTYNEGTIVNQHTYNNGFRSKPNQIVTKKKRASSSMAVRISRKRRSPPTRGLGTSTTACWSASWHASRRTHSSASTPSAADGARPPRHHTCGRIPSPTPTASPQ